MKKILVLLCFILYIISAHAQYCSIKKGRTAYYVTTEVKERFYFNNILDYGKSKIEQWH